MRKRRHKLQRPPLRPGKIVFSFILKSAMAAVLGHFKMKKRMRTPQLDRHTRRGENGVVLGVYQQGRHTNTADEVFGRGIFVKICCVTVAAYRCAKILVEIAPTTHQMEFGEVEPAGILDAFYFDFLYQRPHKSAAIKGVFPTVENFRARFEVAGRRKNGSGTDLRRHVFAERAEVLHGDSGTHAVTHKRQCIVTARPQRVGHHCADVLDVAVVIHSESAIHFARARATVPGQHIPAILRKKFGCTANILAIGVAFQSVRQHDEAAAVLPNPVEVEEIVVGSSNSFALIVNVFYAAQDAGGKRLQMAVVLPKRRAWVGGFFEERHSSKKAIGKSQLPSI